MSPRAQDRAALCDRIAALPAASRSALESRLLAALGGTAAVPAVARIPPRAPGAVELPLSYAQERLWFIDQLVPGSPLYNIPAGWNLGGAVDAPAMERALAELVRRHESLRTVFTEREGQPFQVIEPPGPVPLRVVEPPAGGAEPRLVQQVAAEEGFRPFDLRRGPLLRAALIRQDEQRSILLITVHHIVADGWSMGVLIRELWLLYQAARGGLPPPLLEPVLQYGDYAVWQRASLPGERMEALVRYWRDHLAGAPPVFTLPPARPRPPVQQHRGRSLSLSISPAVTTGVRELCRREGVTPFMVFLAVYALVLATHAGENDVVIGTPIANRTRAELEPLIGFFVNTLVLRLRLDPARSFVELLRHVREVTLAAYAHQDVPFERVVEELHPQRNMSHNPLFQVMLVLQNTPMDGAGEGDEGPADESERPTKFDLTLTLVESPGRFTGTLEYSVDLYDRDTVARVVEQFTALLERLVHRSGEPLREIDVLTPAERLQVERLKWDGPGEAHDQRGIHHVLDDAVVSHGDRLAVEGDGVRWTYRELAARCTELEDRLRALHLPAEAPVAVLAERSPELVVAFFAILRAGAAYLPIDPRLPPERAAFLVRDAGAMAVITSTSAAPGAGAALAAAAGAKECPVLVVDPRAPVEAVARPAPAADPDRLAYIIYTSGSTGRPKGVDTAHRGLVNMVDGQHALFGVGPDDRVLPFAPVSFDASLFEILLAVREGATLVFWPGEELWPGPAMAERLDRDRITVLTAVPSALRELALYPHPLPHLSTVISAAEACTPDVVAAWAPGRRLFNAYGPTETSCWIVGTRLEPGPGPVPLGRTINGVRALVLDAFLRPVPLGAVGELYLGGVAVGRGYRHQPGLTAERFIPDPFAERPGDRLYRTGDRVRWAADGRLEYLGRSDGQIKLRGFRIELSEIEEVLAEHPEVSAAAVVLRASPDRLVAFVTARGEAPAEDELRAWLRRRLPEYMMPASISVLPAMPRNTTGKLDRRALPEVAARDASSIVPPRTQVEVFLAGLWKEILGVPAVGMADNFFELGGHSLLATRMVARARAAGFELSLRDLFERPTLGDLASAVRMREGGDERITVLDRARHRVDRTALDAGAAPASPATRADHGA